MADIVNLNKYRKARNRVAKSLRAAENRALHGRSRNERRRDSDETARIGKALDDTRLDADRDDQEPA